MHIPDGYLSPSTCAALYAAAAPFWYVALQRVKLLLHTRFVPLLAVFAAFSFVIMMFNIPLPGGTTGHAAGIGVAAVVLGPWGSAIAVSVALLIQALFFGDGGVLAFGANSFNIAIVGSLVSWGVYRVLGGSAPIDSPRRPIAATVAGYAAINVAAFLTAVQLGIQPLLYVDAAGTPLYAPYPLWIAIPAMMIGHITVAGLAEGLVAGGIVAYLQRANPSLLTVSAPGARAVSDGEGRAGVGVLWAGLAVLIALTPLGLLAAGTAWGEWAAEDFADPAARAEIAAASGDVAPPASAPAELERLGSLWSAPMPDYAPAFMHSEAFGYVVSAIVGVAIVVAVAWAIGWLARRGARGGPAAEAGAASE